MQVIDIVERVFGASVVHADDSAQTSALKILETPFHGRGSVADWSWWIAVSLAILILVIVAYLVFAHRRSTAATTGFLAFIGLCVLPLFMMLFGGFAGFEGASQVSFCHSCHSAMDLYVDDMTAKESTTLAAVHYNNRYFQETQCYQCHSDYGATGTIKAKIRGLHHLYYWITNAATARGAQQIKYYGTYPNTLCLHCHAGSQKFLAAADGVHTAIADNLVGPSKNTVGFREDVRSASTSCLDCHGPVHPSLADKKKKQAGVK
jgi:nitrate/TMAO reductase-like tetraheme cytochrome c subunit